jgi:Amt family ammonium transporter
MTFRKAGLGAGLLVLFAACPAYAQTASGPRPDSGATSWVLVSATLVLFMTIPGLALFYGGMVRKKNALAIANQSFAITCLVTLLWIVVGYSLAFTGSNPWIGGFGRLMGRGMTDGTLVGRIPESVFMFFQMTFAIITPAVITGAFADRMKFSALLLFSGLWLLFVYCPVAHWVWAVDPTTGAPVGFLAKRGLLDFAGGTVVEVNSGVAGLTAALVLGPRKGFGHDNMAPHNLMLTLMGASMLWVGWIGFNSGSAAAANGHTGMAVLATQVAAAAAGLAWMSAEWMKGGKPSVLGILSGAVAGLVAITPASGYVTPGGALIIGLIAGFLCYWGSTTLKHALRYDDALDAFGVHGIGGMAGTLLTGVFAVKIIGGTPGLLEGNLHQMVVQAEGVGMTIVYTAAVSFLLLKLVDLLVGLRVPPEVETEGLDMALHGEAIH